MNQRQIGSTDAPAAAEMADIEADGDPERQGDRLNRWREKYPDIAVKLKVGTGDGRGRVKDPNDGRLLCMDGDDDIDLPPQLCPAINRGQSMLA
jgi:hypothetical protein